MKRMRAFFHDNALMVAGMLLMLASAGVDGKFMSLWMSDGLAWMGYVLNLVSDASGYVMSNAYGRLQNEDDETKRKLSRFLLLGEFVNIAYSWLFSYLVLRERFVVIFTRAIFGSLATEIEVLAFVSAGFVPLMLTFLGYADSLGKTRRRRRHFRHTEPAIVARPDTVPVVAPQPDTVARLLAFYADNPLATQAQAGTVVARSRQWVSAKLADLEAAGQIHRNGNGVEVHV